MAEAARPALGLSIGATNLAAVTAEHAVTRKPVLTLYRQRPPEVGVPSENPRLDERGMVINDFVDRVGDPAGIVASDGSMHRSEALVADGLRALAHAATGGRALAESVAVTYPAHWGPKAVDALGSALSRVSEWSTRARPLTLIPDAAATLFAARANPGIPARGIVAVCDFGGSGTSITLVDADGDYQPVGPTVRNQDFCGDLIDQALLTSVMANLPSADSFDPSGTSAIGSLMRLRAGCRSAKEQLSLSTVTTLADGLPGVLGDIRITRTELDEAIHDSLNTFMAVLEETMRGNGIRGELAAAVSVGGGANLPAVTTALSGRLQVPVITTPRPQLTAAIGGALRAARGPADASATTPTPAAAGRGKAASVGASAMPPLAAGGKAAGGKTALAEAPPVSESSGAPESEVSEPVSGLLPAQAWSEAGDESRSLRVGTGEYPARQALKFERKRWRPETKDQFIPWYRRPRVVVIGTVVAILLLGMAVAIGMSSGDKPATTPAPGVSTTPAPTATVPPPTGGSPQSAPPATQVPEMPIQQTPPP